MPRPVTPTLVEDGVNGISVPGTPINSSLSMTEYAANPSPPQPSTPKSNAQAIVPPQFLLPNGYPDVFTSSEMLHLASSGPV
jgi:threonine dehydratase